MKIGGANRAKFAGVFGQAKSVQQVSALPFMVSGGTVDVAMVTTRRRRRWVLPKGWPVRDRTLPQSAALEAEEEAGVTGVIAAEPVGTYSYRKRMPAGYDIRCRVLVYPLLVTAQLADWPEKKARKVAWVALGEAPALAGERGLARLLRRLAADDGAVLKAIAEGETAGSEAPSRNPIGNRTPVEP